MFFDDEDDDRFINPDLFHVVRHAISSNLEVTPYGLRSVPTHTEDGIPIRKLYVSNLPPQTTRTELFGVFAQYGFIKSCWLRMREKGPNEIPTPSYAFVTFSNPADAHKALQAPSHEKMLRGRNLRISPADSWHQPAEDAEGRVYWKPRGNSRPPNTAEPSGTDAIPETSTENAEDDPETVPQDEETVEAEDDRERIYTILEVLNHDCLSHILSYVPVRDLISSERVSKRWQEMVQEHLLGIRIFKTSWWQHKGVTLTTAVLRRVLQRLGESLHTLHIDHHWSALNDRTAHCVGKFCPNLEELKNGDSPPRTDSPYLTSPHWAALKDRFADSVSMFCPNLVELKVVGMHTKNWNPLIYGCKQLKSLSFVSCNKLTDTSLVNLVKSESCIESLTVANNTHVTGLFLTGTSPHRLSSLAFYNCYSLQGTVLSAAIENLPNITCLKLDACPSTIWKIIPMILGKLSKLEELSLSEYISVENSPQSNEAFCEALATLSELKTLNLSRNIYITNQVLKQVSQSCPKLENLNISSCNARKTFPPGVSDEGISHICTGCTELRRLDISYLCGLSDSGAGCAARCRHLHTLVARGNANITAPPLQAVLKLCTQLQELDISGCDMVSEEVVAEAVRALDLHPRKLELYIAGTLGAIQECEFPRHPLLLVEPHEDRCNPQLRPDFVDRVFEDSSDDDSFDDLYDPDDFDDFYGPGSDDELFMDDDLEDYEAVYAYGGAAHDILLL